MKLIVTRPAAQAAGWVQRLQALGCDAQALPLIDIEAVADAAPLHEAWARLPQQDLVMFVSANAVRHFFAAAPAGGVWPASLTAGSTGPGTSAALRAAGVPDTLLAEPPADAARFDSEALWQQLQRRGWAGRSVLVVRGEDGRDWLADTLRAHGASVHFVAAYRRRAPRLDAAAAALLARALAEPARHLWLFSSGEALQNLSGLAPQADWRPSQAIGSHPRIVQAALAAGFGRVELVPPLPAALAQRLATWPSIQSAPL